MPQAPHLRRCERYLNRCRSHPNEMRILAIGDSWLSLPGNLWSGRNVVQFLNDHRWSTGHGARAMNILSFAHPGKELADMSRDIDLHQGLTFLQDLGDRRGINYRFEAVIVTGGGNDILPFPKRIIGAGPDGNGAILEEELRKALEGVRASWNDLLSLVAPWECPVIAHGYGVVTPTLKSGKIIIPFKGIGPWVGKHLLRDLKLSVKRGRELIGSVIDRLNDTMSAIPGLSWFDARDTVAAIPPADWHDEIHFFEPGWERLAQRWLQAISETVGMVAEGAPAVHRGVRRRAADLTPQHDALLPFTRDAVKAALARAPAGKAVSRKGVTAKRTTAKKATAKKTAAKTGVAKRTAAKKATTTRATAAKKAGAKKPVARKTPQSKAAAKNRRGKRG